MLYYDEKDGLSEVLGGRTRDEIEAYCRDEGKVFWLEKDQLNDHNLAPYMDEYLQVLEKEYSECFCTYRDNYVPHYR